MICLPEGAAERSTCAIRAFNLPKRCCRACTEARPVL